MFDMPYRFLRTIAIASTAAAMLAVPDVVGAAGGPTVAFNSQVNMTAPPPPAGQVDNFPANKQNEPSIARDPSNGTLIAGSNDEIDEPQCTGAGTAASPGSCPFVAGVGNSGVYVSHDGATTWTQPSFANQCGQTIHTLPGYCQHGLESFGDPAITVGPRLGTNGFSFSNGSVVYYANLALPNGSANPLLAVSRSTTDGASWVDPVIASSSDNPVDFNDKEFVWADANPKSRFFGNVYVSWTLFQGNGVKGFTPEPIVFARSTDGGQTFSKVTRLTSSGNNNAVGGRQGSVIRTGPDGTVYVLWEGAINHHSELLEAISHDGGASFGKPEPVAAVNDIPSPMAGSSFRTDSFPSVDVNQVTGEIDVAWANFDAASSTALIEFTDSTDGGATFTAPVTIGGRAGAINAFFPGLADSPDGNHVFVGWPAQTWKAPGTAAGAGVVKQFAAFAVRTNGTFGPGALLSTASGDPDGSSTNSLGSQFLGDYATAVSSDSRAVFVWTDTRNEAPCTAVDAFRAGAGPRPNPDVQCPADAAGRRFGNSDIFAGAVDF
jgi:hypothetical protein